MLIEKLLLHVLIILSPILIYSIIYENHSYKDKIHLFGIFQAVAGFFCMAFPYPAYGLFWDLRYIPLTLAFLYCGYRWGIITFFAILLARLILGGDAVIFGMISITLSSLGSFVLAKWFWKFNPKQRIILTALIGFWPALVQLGILFSYLYFSHISFKNDFRLYGLVLIFIVIEVIAITLAAKLNETLIEKKILHREIQRAEKLNTLSEMAASIAHEVRNPLTVVKGFLQLMQESKNNQSMEYLPLVLSELGRAEGIINDYLNFAKPQFDKVEIINLKQCVSDVITLLEPLALKQNVKLKGDLVAESLISTDKNQFKQALINLIKNAIEATNSGGYVHLKLFEVKEKTIITIRDNGKGMTKEQLSRIGTLFYSTKEKGTGVGTTISVRIIEAMNGTISFESNLDEGTKVTITLPKIELYEVSAN
ncbi:ATP-binding protein [Gottfriedia luciferensis]|uniref:ATP-binding protein n=1 Tax=Gottfriedia luciferensis TaxID=178774 RepID=UPI000B442522|nr:ATP-binding protein [Gottfriedia luciferensis]